MNAQERLKRNAVLAAKIDLASCALGVLMLVAVSVLIWLFWPTGESEIAKVLLLAASLAGVATLVRLLRWLSEAATDRFAPSWLVDESNPSVLVIRGTIPSRACWRVVPALLRTRPGYVMLPDSWERYGHVYAAVPAADVGASPGA